VLLHLLPGPVENVGQEGGGRVVQTGVVVIGLAPESDVGIELLLAEVEAQGGRERGVLLRLPDDLLGQHG
jgi:hypothetical protein